MVLEGDFTCDGEHPTECTDDVLWKCAPETCTTLLNQCHLNKFNKKEKIIMSIKTYMATCFLSPNRQAWKSFHYPLHTLTVFLIQNSCGPEKTEGYVLILLGCQLRA